MGQEERKNKAKMEKTQIQLATTNNEYEAAVKALEETTGRWNRDWKAACDVRPTEPSRDFMQMTNRSQKFQDLEEERLDFMKSSLWTFANVASTVCVSDDAVGFFSRRQGLDANICSLVRRFVYRWKVAKSKRTLTVSSKRKAPVKRSPIPPSTSTFVEESSAIPRRRSRRMTVTRWRSFSERSTLLSEALLHSRPFLNPIMTLNQILPCAWVTVRIKHLPAVRRH